MGRGKIQMVLVNQTDQDNKQGPVHHTLIRASLNQWAQDLKQIREVLYIAFRGNITTGFLTLVKTNKMYQVMEPIRVDQTRTSQEITLLINK